MERLKFSLTSDQLELLLAFEEKSGLNQLAEAMAKDPSVVSRGLQKIAEDFPVLEKIKGRWELTPLGFQTNEITRSTLKKYKEVLTSRAKEKTNLKNEFSDKSVLLIINAQNGLLDKTLQGRNNSDAETNIAKLLGHWRSRRWPVIHVKHVSENPESLFYKNSQGVEILEPLKPIGSEVVVEKSKSSGFIETNLEKTLAELGASHLLLTGFTANECIDSTARDSQSLGFNTFVIGDATAMFDIRDASGRLLKAERIHRLTLANMNALFAKVVSTADCL